MEKTHEDFMRIAIELSEKNVLERLGGPFGAVIVKNGQVISQSGNKVTSTNDPTAHAEVSAIRLASHKLQTFDLTGCILYSSCEPCPMCLSAIYWAKIEKIYFANSKTDACNIGFDDKFIYDELNRPLNERKLKVEQILRDEAKQAFEFWNQSTMKKSY